MRADLAILFTLAAATPATPVVSYDPATNFGHYRSYSWAFNSMPGGMDPTLYRQVHVSIDHALGSHGFVKTNQNQSDFAVAFTVGPRAKVHPSDYGHYAFYYEPKEAAAHQNWVNNELAQQVDRNNTLAIDIYDAAGKHSVWHGLAAVPIVPHTRQAIVEHEVDEVLSLFPPKLGPMPAQ